MSKTKDVNAKPSTPEYDRSAARPAYKLTDEKKELLFEALREGKTVHAAAKLIGVSPTTVFMHRRADAEFGKQFDAAYDVGIDHLEEHLRRMAVEKNVPGLFNATIAILNARRPDRYRQNVKIESTKSPIPEASLSAARERAQKRTTVAVGVTANTKEVTH